MQAAAIDLDTHLHLAGSNEEFVTESLESPRWRYLRFLAGELSYEAVLIHKDKFIQVHQQSANADHTMLLCISGQFS